MSLITFHDGTTSRSGFPVGDYLVLAQNLKEGWGIFKNVRSRDKGGRAIKLWFRDKQSAQKFATRLDNLFSEFMFFWNTGTPLCPFECAKWTSEQHLKFFCYLSVLEDSDLNYPITEREISSGKIFEKAKDYYSWWTRNQNWSAVR